MNGYRTGRRRKKNFCEFCCEGFEEEEKGKIINKKNSCEFCCSAKLLQDVIVLQILHFSQNLCDLLSSCILCRPLPSVFRLVHMSRFLDICISVHSSMFPPPRRRPGASRNDDHYNSDWRQGEQGWEGGRIEKPR